MTLVTKSNMIEAPHTTYPSKTSTKRMSPLFRTILLSANRAWLGGCLWFCTALVTPAWAWSELVVFGDSLSDTGNHPAALLGLPYPYYNNRISDGPNAVDTLAASLGLDAEPSRFLTGSALGGNYAVSGANAFGSEQHGLSAQLSAYFSSAPSTLPAGTLYVVMIGGNDIRDAAYINDLAQAKAVARTAANAALSAVKGLLARGAGTLLVVGVPDVGTTPETRSREARIPGIAARTTVISDTFNQQLTAGLRTLGNNTQKIFYYDSFAALHTILANPAAHGFSNVRDACFEPTPYGFHPDCDFTNFVFFDSIHPTAKMHAIWGQGMTTALRGKPISPINQPVTLPPILHLLLSD